MKHGSISETELKFTHELKEIKLANISWTLLINLSLYSECGICPKLPPNPKRFFPQLGPHTETYRAGKLRGVTRWKWKQSESKWQSTISLFSKPTFSHHSLAVTIQIIATERIRFEIVCAQSQEENLRWGFQDVSKVSWSIIESKSELTSTESEFQDISCRDGALETLAGLGGGPGGQGRGESPPLTGDWDRSIKDISARGGMVDTEVFRILYVYILYVFVWVLVVGNQGRWMLIDEDSETCNLYIPLILDRVE